MMKMGPTICILFWRKHSCLLDNSLILHPASMRKTILLDKYGPEPASHTFTVAFCRTPQSWRDVSVSLIPHSSGWESPTNGISHEFEGF